MTSPNPQEGGKPDVCQSCYKTDATEGVHVRRDGGEWVASTLRRCANPECQEIRSGSLEDRFTHLRNVYAYKYFGDYELSPEQSVAVWDAYGYAMKVPALLEALSFLANEVDGMRAFEDEVRQVIGHTNWSVLAVRLKEARAALLQATGGENGR